MCDGLPVADAAVWSVASQMEMKMEISRMRQHVYDLANAFGIDLVLQTDIPPEVAAAIRHPDGVRKAVMARVVTDETSYAVVLHELGHLLSPWGSIREALRLQEPILGCHARDRHRWINLKLEEERAAWEWARHYTLIWTVAMEQVEQYAYGTYLTAKEQTR